MSWGREYFTVKKYLEQNRLEAAGFIPFKPRASKRGRSREQCFICDRLICAFVCLCFDSCRIAFSLSLVGLTSILGVTWLWDIMPEP